MGMISKLKQNFFHRSINDIEQYYCSLENDYVYRELAIEMCIDIIANAMLKVDFRTYEKNKRVKNEMYYRLNVSPNGKQNSSEFYKELIRKLFYDNEVLIVSPSAANSELYIADDFSCDDRALKPSKFSGVQIDGYLLNRTFDEDEVIYLKLSDAKTIGLINSYYASYGKLLSAAINNYKRTNARRYVLKGDLFSPQDRSGQSKVNKMMTDQFKAFMEADNAGAAYLLQDSFELQDFSDKAKADSRDIKNLFDDVLDTTAAAMHVPKGILKGDIAGLSDQIDSFLMFCIHPIVALISDEFNLKLFEMDEYLAGNFVKADTTSIKETDITAMATALDKLFAIGAVSVNDVSEKVGTDPIDEDWANKRYVTKNYQEAKLMIENQDSKGGDKDDEKEQPKQIRI
ncbi:phage portal protein [Latilactobacillus curvatus]|uniref:phage portal protein n=1 Tax=Latilactobacillus curvatus TaxID=28038 RepID=UPI0039AFC55E